jgi:TrmH family RNA methyltransferase
MLERITSVQNPRIKTAAKLRNRDDRQSQQRIMIDGVREISRALDANVEIQELFVCEELLRGEAQSVVQRAQAGDTRLFEVSSAVLEKLTFGQRNEGLVAVATLPQRRLADLKLPANALVSLLANVEKPGNVGAIVRSADAAGVNAVLIADGGTDIFNPNAIRASLGTIFALPVVAAAASEAIEWLRRQRIRLFAARVEADQCYSDADFTGATAFILGSEAQGLGNSWQADDIIPISLPVHGVGDSLNVSVTAGILFYEALRQRRSHTV